MKSFATLAALAAVHLIHPVSGHAQTLTAKLTVKKIVQNTTGASLPNQFQFQITCVPPGLFSQTVGIINNGTFSTPSFNHGTVCTVTELPPTNPKQFDCPSGEIATWMPPVYTPGQNITLTQIYMPSSNIVTVTNVLKCSKPPPSKGSLRIRKSINNPYKGNLTGSSFPIGVKCGGITYPAPALNAANNNLTTVNGIQSGASCTVTESVQNVTVPPAAPGCAKPKKLIWLAPVIAPASVTIVAGGVVDVSITNRLGCQIPSDTAPPK